MFGKEWKLRADELSRELHEVRTELAATRGELIGAKTAQAAAEGERDRLIAERDRMLDTIEDLSAQLGSAKRAPASEEKQPEARSLTGIEVVQRAEQHRNKHRPIPQPASGTGGA